MATGGSSPISCSLRAGGTWLRFSTPTQAVTAVKIKYTWGLDLSGSVQGAGGIGGRLALDTTVSTKRSGRWPAGSARSSRQGLAAQDLRSRTKNYWFLYDANGNAGSEPGRS